MSWAQIKETLSRSSSSQHATVLQDILRFKRHSILTVNNKSVTFFMLTSTATHVTESKRLSFAAERKLLFHIKQSVLVTL